MEHSPERPFVPRPTPTKPQPALGAADFALSRPFVPGAEKERIASLRIESEIDTGIVVQAALPPIERFLDVSAPIANNLALDDEVFPEEYESEDEELPPVEHFVDPLPAVEDFASEASAEEPDYDRTASSMDNPALADSATTDWIETDWQRYDWRAAAALGDTGENEASNAWASTDWEVPRSAEVRPTTPDAIATALDQIAQKLREGDLALPGQGVVSDPATVVATLAALLGIKR
ncbi:MAG TPA: hypothetical protein VEM14_08635 [Gemmatimonadaceae bacterium]|nr:hypothetical protein [Gemmatimonadaceae bacterium]